MAKKTDATEEKIQAVEDALGKTELFIEKNRKIISIVIGIILVVLLGYFGFKKFYLAPREKEAQSQMFMAEKYFEQDSLDKALNGDGNYSGFLKIIEDYSITKSANLAHYYTGICFLKKGQFEKAIDYLEDFNGDDEFVAPMAVGALGDAYMELGKTDKALAYYIKAAEKKTNDLTSPAFYFKVALTYEKMKDYQKALDTYKKIQTEFPKSAVARDIERYIARAEGMLENK
ncbi:MAG: tetratricopeptide repeat protein [Lentimicrobiaceae bacterium]|nr:tetratricopeptide repeat protein [Lentimicrobiaceae bacterium]